MDVLGDFKRFISGKRGHTTTKPFFLGFRSSTAFILATVCIAIFNDILLYAIILPVIPYSITDRADVAEDSVQKWLTILAAAYTASLCVGSLILGYCADFGFSRRYAMLLGLLFLAGSTLFLCLARTTSLFVIARILQGLSGAIVWSAGLALLADTMGEQIGMAMGYASAAMTIGALISPTIGGAVYSRAGYYPVYYVAFGAIFVDVTLRLALVEKKAASQWANVEHVDEERPIELREPMATLPHRLDAATDGVVSRPPDPPAAGLSSLATTGSKAFRYPRLHILNSRRLVAANFGIMVHSGAILMADSVIPLFTKNVFQWNPMAAGLILLCVCVPGLAAPGVGWLADRYGAKLLSAFGFIGSVPPLALLRLVHENTTHDKILLGALLTLLGFTYTFASTPLMAEITYAIQAEEVRQPGVYGARGVFGMGYGLFTFSFALGGTLGSLISGYLVAEVDWSTMSWALAAWMGVGGIVVGLWVGP